MFNLLHEVGHGIDVIVTSNSHVHIYLSMKGEDNKENFNFGRLHFHIRWSYIEDVYWDTELDKRLKVIALAGGSLMSLLLAFFGIYFFNSIPRSITFII